MKLFVTALMMSVLAAGGAAAQEIKREITGVTDDTYLFQNQFHVNALFR